MERAKELEIAELLKWGKERIGDVSVRDLLIAGTALYAGEGTKGGHAVGFANTNDRMVSMFVRGSAGSSTSTKVVYASGSISTKTSTLTAATRFWSAVTDIPTDQFRAPYRAEADGSLRLTKHEYGCVYVCYSCSRTHRAVIGLVQGLLRSASIPG